LLLSTASAYDDQFKAKKASRCVMYHDFQHDKYRPGDDTDYQDEDRSFDIDCLVSSIQAYANYFQSKQVPKSNSNKVLMPSNKWISLSKAIWDRLEDKFKAIIL
jgi:hypothetical protein